MKRWGVMVFERKELDNEESCVGHIVPRYSAMEELLSSAPATFVAIRGAAIARLLPSLNASHVKP